MSMQAVGVVDCTDVVAEGNANLGVVAAGAGQGGDDDPSQTPAALAATAAASIQEGAQGNKKSGAANTGPKRKYVQWTSDMEYALMAQAHADQVHTAPHGQKGKRLEILGKTLNSLDLFIAVGGVRQSKIEEMYRKLMADYREKVDKGEWTSGEREGQLSPVQYLCNEIMKEEDVFFACKTAKTEEAQQELARKEAKGQEVLDMTLQPSGSRERKKRRGTGKEGSSQGGSPEGTPGPAIDLDASLVKFLKSQTDDPETKNHKLQLKEEELAIQKMEAEAALLQAKALRDVAVGSPATKKRREDREMLDAETRKQLAENQRMQLQYQSEQAAQSAKMNLGVLAVSEKFAKG